jgi:hypothetical protein
MPTGLTYETFQAAVVNLIPSYATDPNFQSILPLAIDAAELRCYRDVRFLTTHGTFPLGTATVGNNLITIPTTIIVADTLIWGPSQIPIVTASLEFIAAVYTGAPNGPPEYWAPIGNSALPQNTSAPASLAALVGPAPDQPYAFSVYGTIRPDPLSATNDTTWLSMTLPDLFFAAAMIFFSGYTKNYGAAGAVDDPGMGVNWRSEYERLREGAYLDELRTTQITQQPQQQQFHRPVPGQAA